MRLIKENVEEQQYNTWFKPLVFESYNADTKTLLLQVPSAFFYEYLEENYVSLLSSVLTRCFGHGIKLTYRVVTDKAHHLTQDLQGEPFNKVDTRRPIDRANQSPTPMDAAPQDLDPQLDPHKTFNNYLEGDSNKLPRSIGLSIAEHPNTTQFNPMFIYGPSGCGKTHLVNAIGMRAKQLYPQKRVLYISARLFQVQYTNSVRNNTTNDFINFYQTIDILIIDDIQEFAGVTKTQNTFFHIFNHLHQNGKQLILTSDRAPVLLQGMEERLITRFKWGMVAELEKPTVELRKNILRNKIHRDGLQFPPEVIDYIAENVGNSVRDLEGIVISIMAHSTIYNKEIDLELAQRIVRKVVNCESKAITIDDIITTVCKHFGLENAAIHTKSRKREVVQARQIAMYLAKKHTDFSTAKIGTLIGNKDHATVLHACKTIKQLKEVDKSFRAEIEEIQTALKKV